MQFVFRRSKVKVIEWYEGIQKTRWLRITKLSKDEGELEVEANQDEGD